MYFITETFVGHTSARVSSLCILHSKMGGELVYLVVYRSDGRSQILRTGSSVSLIYTFGPSLGWDTREMRCHDPGRTHDDTPDSDVSGSTDLGLEFLECQISPS